MFPKLRFLLLLLLLTGFSLMPAACSAPEVSASDDEGETPEEVAVPVEVTSLERGAIESVLRFSTNLEAERQVSVLSESSRRVVELRVEEGSEVQRGDLLLRLENDEQTTTLQKVESELRKEQRDYDRQTRLFNQGFLSEEDFSESTYRIEQLELRREEAQRELSYTEVRAPIAGTITQRMVNVGDFVTTNQSLFEMVDFDSIVARIFVPEKELPRLRRGLEARLTASSLGAAQFVGAVERISPVVDPRSGTVKVTLNIPRRRDLRPGLFVDVSLVTQVFEDALLVPKRALVYDSDQIFVYRLQGKDRAERLLVLPALEDKEFVTPQDGLPGNLTAGDQVVIAGQAGLKDNALVKRVDELDALSRSADADSLEISR